MYHPIRPTNYPKFGFHGSLGEPLKHLKSISMEVPGIAEERLHPVSNNHDRNLLSGAGWLHPLGTGGAISNPAALTLAHSGPPAASEVPNCGGIAPSNRLAMWPLHPGTLYLQHIREAP